MTPTWPDTLVARDLRLVPIAPGVVYGTYHYRQFVHNGPVIEGISERVFVKTPKGWRIAVSTAFGLSEGSSPPPVAITGATLVNPGRAAVKDAVIIVRNGRIACAGTKSECPVPAGIEVVDARGKFVGPGIIDAHVHYSQTAWVDRRPDALDVRAQFPYDSVVSALQEHPERFDRAYLCSGVTSVFDVGGYPWSLAMAREHESALDAPRMEAAGPLLTTYYPPLLSTPVEHQFVYMGSDSVVRATVRALARDGSRAVKVWYIAVPDSQKAMMRARLMVAGEEAKKAGLPLIVHATQLGAAKDALHAGAKVLVHSVAPEDIDDEFLQLAKANGTIVIPTLTVYEGYADVYMGRSPAARYPLDCVDKVTARISNCVLPLDSVRKARIERLKTGRMDSAFHSTERNVRRMRTAGIRSRWARTPGTPGPHPDPACTVRWRRSRPRACRRRRSSPRPRSSRRARWDAATTSACSRPSARRTWWSGPPIRRPTSRTPAVW